MFNQMTFWDSLNVTSLPVSEAGAKRYGSRDGRKIGLSGQALAPASLSAAPESNEVKKTSAISGPNSSDSSRRVDLSPFLANRLKERLASVGSMEYSQTWKERITPRGRRYWAHTASVRRTCDKDCTGWPTPQAFDAQNEGKPRPLRYKGNAPSEKGNTRNPGTPGSYRGDLKDYAGLAGWATPKSSDGEKGSRKMEGAMKELQTRNSIDLPTQAKVMASGQISTYSPCETGKPAALNPAHSRWLMGFPAEWDSCGAMAMQSCRKSRRSSSRHI